MPLPSLNKPAVLYVLPKANFFSQGRRGRVTHAIGVARGFGENQVPVHVISGSGLAQHAQELGPCVTLHEVPSPIAGLLADLRWTRSLIAEILSLLNQHPQINFVIIRYASSNGFLFQALPRMYPDRVWVFEVNSLLYHQYDNLPFFVRRFTLSVELRVINHANVTYVVSEGLKSDLLQSAATSQDRILVVPNAATDNLARLAATAASSRQTREEGLDDDGVKFVYLGIFQTYYELELVVEAFAEIRAKNVKTKLHLFGDGPLLSRVQSIAKGHPGIAFPGRYDLPKMLRENTVGENWVLLLPYRDSPICRVGSPTKLFEYMALDRPIITSRVGQLSQILQDGATALFYTAGNRASLVACMQRMVDEPATRRVMMENARNEFLAKHTWQKRMDAFYNTLCRYKRR